MILFCTSLEEDKNTTTVLDIDSHLPFPSTLQEYLEQVFPSGLCWPEEYKPHFRVIDATWFLENFASDRMHMYKAETKEWLAPPPPYACIIRNPKESNLDKYMTINESEITDKPTGSENDPFGTVYSLPQLKARFGVGEV